jgi:hypothetical protein
VVAVVAGNSDAVTLSGLKADTQYQLTVAAVWGGKKYRSRPIVFRTLGKTSRYRLVTKKKFERERVREREVRQKGGGGGSLRVIRKFGS